MNNSISLVVFPTKNLDKAKTFFNKFLGAEPYADSAYYVGYRDGALEVGLDPNGQAVISYIDVEDISSVIKELETVGAEVHMQPKDVGSGLMVAQVKDSDGNILGLRQKPK